MLCMFGWMPAWGADILAKSSPIKSMVWKPLFEGLFGAEDANK